MIIDQGIFQLSAMYLATEPGSEGVVVVFDTRTPVGSAFQTQMHHKGDKQILSVTIPIGRAETKNQ